MTSSSSASSQTLRVGGPEDLLALAPFVFGFEPTSSVVLLGLSGRRPLHARVDVPSDPAEIPEIVDLLVRAVRLHGVSLAGLLFYDADEQVAATISRDIRTSLRETGSDVLESLQVLDGRYRSLLPGRLGPADGIPFDISNHPFRAQAVLMGRVILGSRDEVARSIARQAPESGAVSDVVGEVPRGHAAAESLWARQRVMTAMGDDARLSDLEVARLLMALLDLSVRDDVWLMLRREDSSAWVRFWTDIVRRSPAGLGAAPASLLGFGAWVAGNGALAWCAVDRAFEDDASYTLASLLADGLDGAAHPSLWDTLIAQVAPRDDPA